MGSRPGRGKTVHHDGLPIPIDHQLPAIIPPVLLRAPAPPLRLALPPPLPRPALPGTLLQMAGLPSPLAVARAHAVNADAVSGAVAAGNARGARVEPVGHVEAGHVVRVVAEEVDQRGAGARRHLRYAADAVAVLVHEAREDGEKWRLDAVAVVDVEVVPAALRRELLQVEGYGGVWGVYEP